LSDFLIYAGEAISCKAGEALVIRDGRVFAPVSFEQMMAGMMGTKASTSHIPHPTPNAPKRDSIRVHTNISLTSEDIWLAVAEHGPCNTLELCDKMGLTREDRGERALVSETVRSLVKDKQLSKTGGRIGTYAVIDGASPKPEAKTDTPKAGTPKAEPAQPEAQAEPAPEPAPTVSASQDNEQPDHTYPVPDDVSEKRNFDWKPPRARVPYAMQAIQDVGDWRLQKRLQKAREVTGTAMGAAFEKAQKATG
jgi:hypothetical protein